MVPEKLLDVIKHEGVVSIVTEGHNEPHVVNTWNSYIKIIDDEKILIPVGGMKETEENLKQNSNVQLTMGSREVQGFYNPGTGFLIKGTACITTNGSNYETVKTNFPWARAALEVKIDSAKQTL